MKQVIDTILILALIIIAAIGGIIYHAYTIHKPCIDDCLSMPIDSGHQELINCLEIADE